MIEFVRYEKVTGRVCVLECENINLCNQIKEALENEEIYIHTKRLSLITECTACPVRKGCETEFVCHTAYMENTQKIFQSGKLLSAERARGIPASQLMLEPRNAAKDPEDYFSYVVLVWGNCQAGDRRDIRWCITDENQGRALIGAVCTRECYSGYFEKES